MSMSDETGRRVKKLVDLLNTLEPRYDAGADLHDVAREVIEAFIAVSRPVRIQLGLRHLVINGLAEHYELQGWRPYPKLAPSWDCGMTAVLDAIDRLVAAALSADPFYILDCLDEIHLLIGSGLAGQCTLHPPGRHATDEAA